jgi:hypothetical protein
VISATALVTFTTAGDLTGSGSSGDISGATSLTFTPAGALFGDGLLEASSALTFTTAGDLTGSSGGGDLVGASTLTFTTTGTAISAAEISGATTLTFLPDGTLSGGGAEIAGQTTLTFLVAGSLNSDVIALPSGGDDAPARSEDIRRIAKREKRRQRLEDERGRRFRQALQAAYEAAEGLAETEAPSARVDVQEALADARKAAPEDFRAEVAALDRQARNLATIDRISALLDGIAELQARAWADDDDLTVLLMVM